MSVLQLPLGGWRARAPSKASALRQLLADGRFHNQHEMQDAAGMRFGARLFDLHNGPEPLHYLTRRDELDDSAVLYRQVSQEQCEICRQPGRMRPAERMRLLELRNAELQAEVDRLRRKVEDLEQHLPPLAILPDGGF